MKNRRFFLRQNRHGFSLLEAALALAILGIVIAGIWSLSAGVFGTDKKNRLAQQVIYTVESTRNYLRHTDLGQTGTMDTEAAWDAGLLPDDLRRNNRFVHAYGDTFAVNFNNRTIGINLANISPEACTDLIYSRLGGSTAGATTMGLIRFSTGGDGNNADFSFNNVTQLCNSRGNVSVSLVFRS